MIEYLIGIDGGGTKTLALLADAEGQILARGSAGTANYHSVGARQACSALDAALADLFEASGLPPQPVRALVLGLAGVDRPEDRAVFEEWARGRQFAGRFLIANDAELVLAAGTPANWGVALICGTGSISYGRDPIGRTARAGGWGYLLGDEGSGFAVGLAALHAVARAADGRGPATTLTGLVLEHWSLAAPAALFHRVYQEDAGPSVIAALAPLVEQAATGGDSVAEAILTEAARELALAIVTVVHRLGLAGPVPCALAGGMIANSQRLAADVTTATSDLGIQLAPIATVLEPARGALRLARELR